MKKEELEIQRGHLYTIVWYKMKFLYKKHSFKEEFHVSTVALNKSCFRRP